ncbi:MAG: hypothetical protein WA581_00450, partial [Candidatus Acidiferrales bacterium]
QALIFCRRSSQPAHDFNGAAQSEGGIEAFYRYYQKNQPSFRLLFILRAQDVSTDRTEAGTRS